MAQNFASSSTYPKLPFFMSEFNASYQPEIDGQPIQCSAGKLVPNLEALPTIVCDAVDLRIRTA